MDQFIASIPKAALALIVMILGLLALRQIQTPITICDAQLDIFRDSQKRFLFKPKVERSIEQPEPIIQLIEICLKDNGPGGCFELFKNMKKMAIDMRNIPEQCTEAAGEEEQIKKWLWRSLKLMVELAWGERAPATYMQKNGWFDASDISLFCDLKRHAIRIYGREKFDQWQEERLRGMPKAEKLSREEVWPRSILSTPCESYR